MEKYYYELVIKPESYYELFLDLVSSLTMDAIEEKDESIIIRSEDSLENIKDGVEAFSQELSNAFGTNIECKITLEKKENQDWIKIYQQSVAPVEVEQFYIHPSWEAPKDGKLNISIDPTLAFGSGHHETTSTCLKAISKYVKDGMYVCDVGCGSGILGIASAKLGAIVDICDTDEVAVEDALKNFEKNGVSPNRSWEGSASQTKEQYDITIANIVADVLVFIHKDLKKITKKDGIIILSGIMEQYKDKVLDKYLLKNETKLLEEIKQNEWITLILRKVD